MAAQFEYGPTTSTDEIEVYARIAAESFAVSTETERGYIELVGAQNLRLLHAGSAVVAGLAVLQGMAQYYGGKRVPCAGVAAVATDARVRGGGAGTALMRALVQELHAAGTPLAALYPATQPLYRRAGFEQAGGRWEIQVPSAALDLRDRTLPLRAVGEEDLPALRALHLESLRPAGGGMERNAVLWSRTLKPGGEPCAGTAVVGASGALEGYVLTRTESRGHEADLQIRDLVARTPQAATRLLTFLADHRTTLQRATWFGAAADPLLALVREQEAKVTLQKVWMLRICDVPAALSARGYPAGMTGALDLEIFDEVIAGNRGRFRLEVGGGNAEVRAGGEGRLKIHVRGLAALYTGWLSPEALALTGLLEGPEADRRMAASLFAGPAPAMRDYF